MSRQSQPTRDLKSIPACHSYVWHDRQANTAQTTSLTIAEVDTYPSERWALYANAPNYHKITEQLED